MKRVIDPRNADFRTLCQRSTLTPVAERPEFPEPTMMHRRLLLSIALLACFTSFNAQAADTLRAGAAAVDVTPQEFPLNMPGGFSENPATKAHDPLHARALVLDDGQIKLAMVVLDNLGAPPEVLNEANAIASKATGIPAERMLISSTHTHSGPSSNTTEGPAPAVAYRKLLIAGLAKSIIDAHAALRPAAVGAASHPLPEEVFNRRWFLKPSKMPLNPFGKLDMVKMNPGNSPDVLDYPAGPTRM
jgi:neutral ceramidase